MTPPGFGLNLRVLVNRECVHDRAGCDARRRGIAAARKAKPIDARAAELIGRAAARVGRSNDVARCRKVTAEAAETCYAESPTAAWGAAGHEECLSCKPGACGDDRRTRNGSGLAVQGAASASGGVLRLVRRLRRLQRRRDAL